MDGYRKELEMWKEKCGAYIGKADKEAFIIYTLIKILENQSVAEVIDLVPESQVDEFIDTSKNYFVKYMQDRTLLNLDRYLKQTHQVLSELYHNLNTYEEKEMFKKFLNNLHIIER